MFKIVALYHFFPIDDCEGMKVVLTDLCNSFGIEGGLIVAAEGVNGTIAGSEDNIDAMLANLFGTLHIDKDKFELKVSYSEEKPFYRMRIKLAKEIITMGLTIDKFERRGINVEPNEWNNLISDPEVTLIDTRNDYEVLLGTFTGAINPNTVSFKDLPHFLDNYLDTKKHKKVAMFCTGGIRCEKSTAYLLSKGFDEVYTLKGGILKYLETIDKNNSLWNGECYVFDQRVSVKHGLELGDYTLCRSCRHPLNSADMKHEHYKEGIHCSHCHLKLTPQQIEANTERHRQILLARGRDTIHLGFKPNRG